jgi:hypothetical protein
MYVTRVVDDPESVAMVPDGIVVRGTPPTVVVDVVDVVAAVVLDGSASVVVVVGWDDTALVVDGTGADGAWTVVDDRAGLVVDGGASEEVAAAAALADTSVLLGAPGAIRTAGSAPTVVEEPWPSRGVARTVPPPQAAPVDAATAIATTQPRPTVTV